MRKVKFVPGEMYHIYNRGLNKQQLFSEDRDYIRFLLLLIYLQSPQSLPNIRRHVNYYIKHNVLDVDSRTIAKIIKTRKVKLFTFGIMPNHFHFSAQELKEGGISWYVQRIQNAYGKYFNIKNEKKGYVFEGRFGAVHVETNNQFLYLSTYHHCQCRELGKWKGGEEKYPWSSYQDYAGVNRWGELLNISLILDQFSSLARYKKFTQNSIAKTKKSLNKSIIFPAP